MRLALAREAAGRLSAEVRDRMTAEDWMLFGAAVNSECKVGAP